MRFGSKIRYGQTTQSWRGPLLFELIVQTPFDFSGLTHFSGSTSTLESQCCRSASSRSRPSSPQARHSPSRQKHGWLFLINRQRGHARAEVLRPDELPVVGGRGEGGDDEQRKDEEMSGHTTLLAVRLE